MGKPDYSTPSRHIWNWFTGWKLSNFLSVMEWNWFCMVCKQCNIVLCVLKKWQFHDTLILSIGNTIVLWYLPWYCIFFTSIYFKHTLWNYHNTGPNPIAFSLYHVQKKNNGNTIVLSGTFLLVWFVWFFFFHPNQFAAQPILTLLLVMTISVST